MILGQQRLKKCFYTFLLIKLTCLKTPWSFSIFISIYHLPTYKQILTSSYIMVCVSTTVGCMNCCLNGEAISLLMQCKNGTAICSRSIHFHYGESDMAFTYGNHKCIRATVIFVRKHHKTPLAEIDRLRSSMPSYLHLHQL